MLNETLPVKIDPRKMARVGAAFKGTIPLKLFTNMTTYLVDDEGDVEVDLIFDRDEQGFFVVNGTMSARVKMICQRCLDVVEQEIKGECHLAVVWNEDAAKALPKSYDPLVLGDDEIAFVAIVEEEMILCLPIVANHADDECTAIDGYESDDSAEEEPAEEKRENPFDVLANFKTRK